MSIRRSLYTPKFLSLIVLCFLSATSAHAGAKIPGAFGFMFGEALPPSILTNLQPDKYGLARNEVTPRIKSPHYDMYSVSIIPATRQVAMISATRTIRNNKNEAAGFFKARKEEMSRALGKPGSAKDDLAAWSVDGVSVYLMNTFVNDPTTPMSVIVVLYSKDSITEIAAQNAKK